MDIKFDGEHDELVIDGVRIALETLATLVDPEPHLFYRFVRDGSTIHVRKYSTREAVIEAAFTASFREARAGQC